MSSQQQQPKDDLLQSHVEVSSELIPTPGRWSDWNPFEITKIDIPKLNFNNRSNETSATITPKYEYDSKGDYNSNLFNSNTSSTPTPNLTVQHKQGRNSGDEHYEGHSGVPGLHYQQRQQPLQQYCHQSMDCDVQSLSLGLGLGLNINTSSITTTSSASTSSYTETGTGLGITYSGSCWDRLERFLALYTHI
mmetsp:Transcript_14718/g.24542  ORF Transcript_14718/g.24542 Transcript_14718/m.24542 type:complete len:192 (+) Transcript_14718:184-759(+)